MALRKKAKAELNMDHSEAVKLQAVERYLLGELKAEQRSQFEEHYFTCPECAADITAAASLVENARELLRTEFPAPETAIREVKHTPWRMWFRSAYAIGVALLLLAIFAYQNLATIPHLRRQLAEVSTPQALASFSLVNSASRGANPLTITAPSRRPFGLYVDIPPGSFADYVCEIRAESDQLKFAVEVSAEEAKETVQLLVPPSKLARGRYVLVVRGRQAGQGQAGTIDVARFPFALQLDR